MASSRKTNKSSIKGVNIHPLNNSKLTVKILTNKELRRYLLKQTFEIPIVQRSLEENKVNGIIREFIANYQRGDPNFFVMHGYTVSICQIEIKCWL